MTDRYKKGDGVRILSGRFKGRETTVRRDDGDPVITLNLFAPFGSKRDYWRVLRTGVVPTTSIIDMLGDLA